LRIVFDKNVPVGVRRFLSKREVRTFVEMRWHPQLENGGLLDAAEAARFSFLVTREAMTSSRCRRRTPDKYGRCDGFCSRII
jgi:hypothetical protein